MAIAQRYCDYGVGNDYIGATFVDGAFTVADMTLTKTGAFAASKINHWLKLSDNGSGNVTPGYYKIASVTSANAVVLATSPKSGATDPTDVVCTQATGTTLLPFRSVQGAYDLIARDATNGDQTNVKASTIQELSTPLVLTTYGIPTEAAPLITRGYTAAANDGGRGHVRYPGGQIINSTTLDFLMFIDMNLEGGANPARMIVLDDFNIFLRCKFIPNKGGEAAAYPLTLGTNNTLIGCEFSQDNGYGFASQTVVNDSSIIAYCYAHCVVGFISTGNFCTVISNIILMSQVGSNAILVSGDLCYVTNNSIYQLSASTVAAIDMGNVSGRQNSVCMNNIVCGYSGVGGKAISAADNIGLVGHNAFFNNTANYAIAGDIVLDLTAFDVALGANPFTDAANGDFSLTDTAKTALRSLGYPSAYLGAHANSDPHITIGAMQYGPEPPVSGAASYERLRMRARVRDGDI